MIDREPHSLRGQSAWRTKRHYKRKRSAKRLLSVLFNLKLMYAVLKIQFPLQWKHIASPLQTNILTLLT